MQQTYECRPCDTVASLTNDAIFVWTSFFFAMEASSSNLIKYEEKLALHELIHTAYMYF